VWLTLRSIATTVDVISWVLPNASSTISRTAFTVEKVSPLFDVPGYIMKQSTLHNNNGLATFKLCHFADEPYTSRTHQAQNM
jgi:hypothetical protein